MTTTTDKWDAKDYANNSTAQESWANELISKLNLQGNESLLDIGCGDGKITASIADKLVKGKVVGIDRSESMVEFAKSQFNLPNLSFYVREASEISLEEEFDIVFSNAVLHWVKDHKTVLFNIKKHLNGDGKILFQMGGHGNAREVQNVFDQAAKSVQWKKYFDSFVVPYRFCRIDDYENWLEQTGYEQKRVELILKDMVHENEDSFRGWLRTTWFPYTNQIPESKQEAFIDCVVQDYLKEHPVDFQGRTHVKMIRLEVEATIKN